MPKLFALLALLLATGLIAVGCGDDEDDGDDETTVEETTEETGATGTTGATGEEGSDSEVVSQVNEICKDTEDEITKAFGENDIDTVVAEINDTLDQMRAVEGAEDDPAISEFIDLAQEDVDALEANPDSLARDTFEDADKAAEEAGLTECID